MKMVVTDLDGTLLNSYGKISNEDHHTLNLLGQKGVVRVIATGRSPFSFESIPMEIWPIDYLVFSSGAGVMHWPSRSLLKTSELNCTVVQTLINTLVEHSVDFMVHEPIPTNHRFQYYSSGKDNADFYRRIDLYINHCSPLLIGVPYRTNASQVISIIPKDIDLFENLSSKLKGVKIIRTTSPLDGQSIWMELFSSDVSKAQGVLWLCNSLGVSPVSVVVVGNDYNDLDMLETFERSYVVANAPDDLSCRFTRVASNCHSGFSEAVKKEGLLG
jgi:hydroxymethylpyrimidine pyrophosphatase-like HAD family hydrolase